jgi:hypothetical protein
LSPALTRVEQSVDVGDDAVLHVDDEQSRVGVLVRTTTPRAKKSMRSRLPVVYGRGVGAVPWSAVTVSGCNGSAATLTVFLVR